MSQARFLVVPLYTVIALLLGASVTAGVFVIHVVVVPLIFKYSKTFRRCLVFANFVQWPLNLDYEHPEANGVECGRNMKIEHQSKIDNCNIKIGIWHILPKSACAKIKKFTENMYDDKYVWKLYEEELTTSKRPVIFYCHGNSNSRGAGHRVRMYKFFQKMDYHTITFDYRGYGDSTNVHPTEMGVVEDALVVYQWLRSVLHQDTPVYVWGHSLGTGISSHMLGNLPELSRRLLGRETPLPSPNGLILEAPFNNLADEVAHHPLAVVSLVTMLPYFDAAFVSPFRVPTESTFTTDRHLESAGTIPVLILHAKDDVVVPFIVGLKLYKHLVESRSSGGAPVKLHVYEAKENLGHKYICEAKDLDQVIGEFVSDNLKSSE